MIDPETKDMMDGMRKRRGLMFVAGVKAILIARSIGDEHMISDLAAKLLETICDSARIEEHIFSVDAAEDLKERLKKDGETFDAQDNSSILMARSIELSKRIERSESHLKNMIEHIFEKAEAKADKKAKEKSDDKK